MGGTEIRVRGTVQGVGFRPTVWRLAQETGLTGEVLNDGAGVLIRARGDEALIQAFVQRLREEAPPLSRIESVEASPLADCPVFEEFKIVGSAPGENRTRVTPDAATCEACQQEVLDPAERRFEYPFANCTHCGPRFTIVNEVPYDRTRTTMADFPMCDDCAKEYEDPADRRFHAQPIACAVCGPFVWLESLHDAAPARVERKEAILKAVERLQAGEIVAIRGLGGFHLACDAGNNEAVAKLRSRKRRYGKPFALMVKDLDLVRRYCELSAAEAEVLQSPEAPIVLLRRCGNERLPDALAPGLNNLGFMLPYTPLHLLIVKEFNGPLVMTSGNVTDEPQITGLETARAKLSGIADWLLMHNRDIANRIDDSVVKLMDHKPRLFRRARGYTPAAISLPPGFENSPDLLAYGAELKSTFCLVKDGAAIVSQHQGDLEDEATFDDYQRNLRLYTKMYDHDPEFLVADLHPEYLSSKLARDTAEERALPLVEVQHHHAHIASAMAENGIPRNAKKVLGISLDGLGFGEDGAIWGGEFLLADYQEYQRLGSLKPVAMLGGAQAIREPWRNAFAHLSAAFGWDAFANQYADLDIYEFLSTKPLETLRRMMEKGLNAPLASSAGRLFDAVAAVLGLTRERAMFEGQGAMELEAIAEEFGDKTGDPYPFALGDSNVKLLDPSPMWRQLASDLANGAPHGEIAVKFHRGLAIGIGQMVAALAAEHEFESAVLSGGVAQNKILFQETTKQLVSLGLSCITHESFPPNDGGLALGQAAIAAAKVR